MRAKILIADDHASVRAALKAVLERGGEYEVCCEAKDGLEAIQLAKRCRHDLVILDLLMPNMNGFRTAKAISKLILNIRIVLHTLYGGAAVEQEAKKFGVHAVVPKLDSSNLPHVLRQLLSPEDPTDVPAAA